MDWSVAVGMPWAQHEQGWLRVRLLRKTRCWSKTRLERVFHGACAPSREPFRCASLAVPLVLVCCCSVLLLGWSVGFGLSLWLSLPAGLSLGRP